MAKRRMFSLDVVDTDDFLDMPSSTQNLYFHLGMRADDDGFVSNPKKITRVVNCCADDFKLLITKGFIIPFESGVCVIRDWRQNNYIQTDRYHPTLYLAEKDQLGITKSGQFYLLDTECIQPVSKMEAEVRLGKDRLEIGKSKDKKGYVEVDVRAQAPRNAQPLEENVPPEDFEERRQFFIDQLERMKVDAI